jgi:hypothetical protein
MMSCVKKIEINKGEGGLKNWGIKSSTILNTAASVGPTKRIVEPRSEIILSHVYAYTKFSQKSSSPRF